MSKGIQWAVAFLIVAAFNISAADKETRKERRAEKIEQRETKRDIDKRIVAINHLDNDRSALQAGLAAISKETAVPLPKIEAEHKEHPNVGLAGLFMAHELAVHTHKPVEHFIKAHREGKSWNELATANNQNLDKVEQKLDRIEAAMRSAK
jgi:hypothetical protein